MEGGAGKGGADDDTEAADEAAADNDNLSTCEAQADRVNRFVARHVSFL